jgi:hypothetical protein
MPGSHHKAMQVVLIMPMGRCSALCVPFWTWLSHRSPRPQCPLFPTTHQPFLTSTLNALQCSHSHCTASNPVRGCQGHKL